jgi:hypothetical protein
VLAEPPLERVPSGAPGRGTASSGVAGGAAVCLRAVVHGAVVPRVPRPGLLRFARRTAGRLAAALPGRRVRVTAGSACAGGELKGLPAGISRTARLRGDAALRGLPPERTGGPGRPRVKGKRLPSLAGPAAAAEFSQATVTRYRKAATIEAAPARRPRYAVSGPRPVTVAPVRDKPGRGFGIALVATDTAATIAQVTERHASRRPAEVSTEDPKQLLGAGQARNRAARAAEATIPFEIAAQATAVTWHATAGRSPGAPRERRRNSPRHTTKPEPSTSDMTAPLRRVLIAARFKAPRPHQPTCEELHAIRLAWEDAAA